MSKLQSPESEKDSSKTLENNADAKGSNIAPFAILELMMFRLLYGEVDLHRDPVKLAEAEKTAEKTWMLGCALIKMGATDLYSTIAEALITIADFHTDFGQLTKAEIEYMQALALFRILACKKPSYYKPDSYKPDVATTLNSLAFLHCQTDRPSEAEKEYKESIVILQDLAQKNPYKYNYCLARSLYDLANIHYDAKRLDEAEDEYVRALATFRKSARKLSLKDKSNVATTLRKLASLHCDAGRLEETLKVIRKNEEKYDSSVDLARLRQDARLLAKAEIELEKVVKFYQKLTKKKPDIYKPTLARELVKLTQVKLAFLPRKIDRTNEVLSFLSDSISIYRDLAKTSPKYQKKLNKALALQREILEFCQTATNE